MSVKGKLQTFLKSVQNCFGIAVCLEGPVVEWNVLGLESVRNGFLPHGPLKTLYILKDN